MARAYPDNWDSYKETMNEASKKWKAFKQYSFNGGELTYAEWVNTYNNTKETKNDC